MNSTLVNGLNLLQVLADAPEAHSVSDLARETGFPKSHIHRLLQTLVESQYVEKNEQRRYSIGVGALRLGHALLRDIPLRRRFLPGMVSASKKMGLPLTLALPFGSQAISVAYVHHDGEIRPTSETLGAVLPIRSSALGKLFLAHLPEDKIEATLASLDYTPKGPNSHNNPKSLRQELQRIQKQGYSLNNQESSQGSASISIPYYEQGRLCAGIGISGSADQILGDPLQSLIKVLEGLISESTPIHKASPS